MVAPPTCAEGGLGEVHERDRRPLGSTGTNLPRFACRPDPGVTARVLASRADARLQGATSPVAALWDPATGGRPGRRGPRPVGRHHDLPARWVLVGVEHESVWETRPPCLLPCPTLAGGLGSPPPAQSTDTPGLARSPGRAFPLSWQPGSGAQGVRRFAQVELERDQAAQPVEPPLLLRFRLAVHARRPAVGASNDHLVRNADTLPTRQCRFRGPRKPAGRAHRTAAATARPPRAPACQSS